MKQRSKLCMGDTSLWSSILRAKYERNINLRREISYKAFNSIFQKTLVSLWPKCIDNHIQIMDDGNSIRFWDDNYLNLENKLSHYVVAALNSQIQRHNMAQYTNGSGNDYMLWKFNSNSFFAKSAYASMEEHKWCALNLESYMEESVEMVES